MIPVTDDTESEDEQTQYGGTEDKEPTTDIDEDEEEEEERADE